MNYVATVLASCGIHINLLLCADKNFCYLDILITKENMIQTISGKWTQKGMIQPSGLMKQEATRKYVWLHK